MPNLLKSLPREILDNEDSKFIYNVLNPILFEKIRDSDTDITKTFELNELFDKPINPDNIDDSKYFLPTNINIRELQLYLDSGTEKNKLSYLKSPDLINELDDIKDYIQFYFNIDGYKILKHLTDKYYFIKNEYEKNNRIYTYNYEQYLETADIKKKKVYKTSYMFYKKQMLEFKGILDEFDLLLTVTNKYNTLSVNQLVDEYARVLSSYLKIKTFDNDIVFASSVLFKFLNETIVVPDKIIKKVFSGKTVVSENSFDIDNIFQVIAILAMEISTIVGKYNIYLSKLMEYNQYAFALQKSEHKHIKTPVFKNLVIDLESDNLTYYLNSEKNELEIYLYFSKDFKIDESTLKLTVNNRIINKSIITYNGNINSGYTIFNYMDDDSKYYKITVHDYLITDLTGEYLNYDINDITVNTTVLKTFSEKIENHSSEIETTSFLDNFTIYRYNEKSKFYEELKIPYKIKVDIQEKEERYIRTYTFEGVDAISNKYLQQNNDLIITYCAFDYMYTPKLYVDFFKHNNDQVSIKYNTILQYVLIDDIIQKDFEISYFKEIDVNNISMDYTKNVLMYDGRVFKKLYDEFNQMVILNPYDETNLQFVSKINYSQYLERNHVRDTIIDDTLKKIPFYKNILFLEKFQFNSENNTLIFNFMNGQKVIPLNETLVRGKNYEKLSYDKITKKMLYYGVELCENNFVVGNSDGIIHVINPLTNNHDEIETFFTENINIIKDKNIFFDIYQMKHCIVINGKQYSIANMYVSNTNDVLKYNGAILYVDSLYGIIRYKDINGKIWDIDLINDSETRLEINDDDEVSVTLIIDNNRYLLDISPVNIIENKHRLTGMNSFSLFYAGNALPENSNSRYYGRENIYNSMMIPDDIYKIGHNEDFVNDQQQHNLLAEQMDLDLSQAPKYGMQEEQFIMFKSSTASLKGLESYVKSSLKSISPDINISPVYLVQRNRFISEWAKVSNVLPSNVYTRDALKDLVADLMETKLINGSYNDLMTIFKNNEYEKFSLVTNDIHSVLVHYMLRYLNDSYLIEDFNYYLIFKIWMDQNLKKITDFIKEHADEKTITIISNMVGDKDFEREKLFYIFVNEVEKLQKVTLSSYKPIGNYSDWLDVEKNNHVHFDKPFKYDIIDISEFITMPIEWEAPLLMIRPLVDDGIFVRRDYRFLDNSIVTNSQVTYDDAYNEYIEESKFKLTKPVDYLRTTLEVLQDLSLSGTFDFYSVNLVIVRWIVERFIPNYILHTAIISVDDLKHVITNEFNSVEHPNLLVSFNKIKDNILLSDLGNTLTSVYNEIISLDYVKNSSIVLEISDINELIYLDKIKKPIEHYFDFLFYKDRLDLITKILALFTEDVIASSMLDLSLSINIKNANGDETYDLYEKMIHDLFQEFLPFHTVLDKIIFTIKIMESKSIEALSKQLDVGIDETTMIDIFSNFIEKVRIQVLDNSIIFADVRAIFPSEGFKLIGDHYEFPHDMDRCIQPAGHNITPYDDETYAVDDEWYIRNIDDCWGTRSASVTTPPQFANIIFDHIPDNEYEKVADVYLNEYFKIKQTIFEQDNRIDSYFVDFVPTVNITQGINENPEINVTEDYLISIDTTFNIRFYNMYEIGHDEFGLDEYMGPEDQSSLIGARDAVYQNILHDFYEKINVSLLDSVWTYIKVVYDMVDMPGHDEFGIDEYYHQSGPSRWDQELGVMVYDGLLEQGFHTDIIDMTDISLIDNKLSIHTTYDVNELMADTRINDTLYVNIAIWAGRSKITYLNKHGIFLPPGQDEFLHDEFYHNSYDLERMANLVDTDITDYMDVVRIDFGFMRFLPTDPYSDMIDKKFYRINQPGSEAQKTKIGDKFSTNVRIYGKDYLRVLGRDFYSLNIIDESLRRAVYQGIGNELISDDLFITNFSETLLTRHIHHDFREHIIAVDKYAGVLDDTSILNIFGANVANIERDNLFKLELGDTLLTDIKIKHPVERSLTKFDKDYLTAIRIEEDTYFEYRYRERRLAVRFVESLHSYFRFNIRSTVTLTETDTLNISTFDKETSLTVGLLDKVFYGDKHIFDIAGMKIGISDELKDMWSNKIYKDSLIASAIDGALATEMLSVYQFKDERIYQPHNEYGHMGYTDESLNRSVDSKLNDSMLLIATDLKFVSNGYINTYDIIMDEVKEFHGNFIQIVISDSLKTYINIKQKPWMNGEFDDFGHNEFPHMLYHGESDEFGITTEIRERLNIDASAWLYNTDALVNTQERIMFGDHTETPKDFISASLLDDLKIISIGFSDKINVATDDITKIKRSVVEPQLNIGIQDTLRYGYKMRDSWLQLRTKDSVDYGFEAQSYTDKWDTIKINDWLLFRINVESDFGNVSLQDKLVHRSYGEIYKDVKMRVSIKDTLFVDEYLTTDIYKDQRLNVGITDILVTDSIPTLETSIDLLYKDTVGVAQSEKLGYGPGKWFNESVRGYVVNRLFSSYDDKFDPELNIKLQESYMEYTTISPFRDSTGITTYERLKYGLVFRDRLNVGILRDDHLRISRSWVVNRYGVDTLRHDDVGMEYPDYNSIENTFNADLYDSVKIVSSRFFKDSFNITFGEKLDNYGEYIGTSIFEKDDKLLVNTNDNLMYGVGIYDYLWDQKLWDTYGYSVPYEKWDGLIPHDSSPHNLLGHTQADGDLSQINTGVKENLLYGFDYFFKDTVNIRFDDVIVDTHDYQSKYKDTLGVMVDNRLFYDYSIIDDRDLYVQIRNERMQLNYEFEDTIKTHKYISNDNNSTEEINIYDKTTRQLIETIMKYRMYDQLSVKINSNILETALFSFDDYLSLVTDYKTKIDLYKSQSDGSLAKSMTIIKDKTSTRVDLIFGDFVYAGLKDKLHATEANRPNEYF